MRWLTILLLSLLLLPPLQAAAPEPPDDRLRELLRDAIASSDSFADRFEAEVWLLDMSRRLETIVPDDVDRLRLLKSIHYEASRADLPPELVLSVIQVESHFDRWAISVAGAQGLMQIMPFWLKEIGRAGDNLFHVQTNLRMGCTILKYYLDMEHGDLTRALGRYNGSLGKFKYPNKVFKVLRTRWYRQ
ncbi:MAG TPA: lytic transglycosylase domain-containing protein [Candidatus Tenderia electrophaga]|uniref:Lytic transglycosylase domain-containing protein n=1 Tax=Candidatus Tenderia electrophaga TaxID=1748243 RepID=A0A832J2L5_9GAMM|nr:lytic transglycosylase domain-containing protein [Candidatus Tenderia electrophaga]